MAAGTAFGKGLPEQFPIPSGGPSFDDVNMGTWLAII